MKKILFLLLLPITCFAQSEISNFWEYGTRGISEVINDKNDSYWISRDLIQEPSYGSYLNLNADGTFNSWNSAECANDCFYHSNGTFKKIDETHIRLQINSFWQTGVLCPDREKNNSKSRDLGIFEIKTDEDDSIVMKRQSSLIMRVELDEVVRTITSLMEAAFTDLYYVVAKMGYSLIPKQPYNPLNTID